MKSSSQQMHCYHKWISQSRFWNASIVCSFFFGWEKYFGNNTIWCRDSKCSWVSTGICHKSVVHKQHRISGTIFPVTKQGIMKKIRGCGVTAEEHENIETMFFNCCSKSSNVLFQVIMCIFCQCLWHCTRWSSHKNRLGERKDIEQR